MNDWTGQVDRDIVRSSHMRMALREEHHGVRAPIQLGIAAVPKRG